ncbi:hypothetical protein HYDPIDRAFT_32014, partial [Hydnomerulius pinastri MD-312]
DEYEGEGESDEESDEDKIEGGRGGGGGDGDGDESDEDDEGRGDVHHRRRDARSRMDGTRTNAGPARGHLHAKAFRDGVRGTPRSTAQVVSRQKWRDLKKQPRCNVKSVRRTLHKGQTDDMDDNEPANGKVGRKKREKAKKYKNEDLPGLPQSMKAWKLRVVPMFRDYTATLDDPWEIADTVPYAQKLWSNFFPNIKHSVSYMNEPVFYLRGGFASRAEKAIEAFFNRYACFDDPRDRADYVEWAVREPTEEVDNHGRKLLVPPSDYPYMWEQFNDDNPNNIVWKGAFMHECILETFAWYHCDPCIW